MNTPQLGFEFPGLTTADGPSAGRDKASAYASGPAPYGIGEISEHAAELLEGLNPQQREAVLHEGPPLLIVAGAGSGKTSVLTRRIAFLLAERGVRPGEILAITFTNKAAAEMRERVEALIGPRAQRMWVSTFHATCVRILRAQAALLGEPRNSNFSIYDADDSRRLVGLVVADLDLDSRKFSPRGVASAISDFKNELVGPEEARARAADSGDRLAVTIADIYGRYQDRLRTANAFDFDDLIGETVALLQAYPDIAEYYRRRFRHVLVDEYQDTNHAQYVLVRELVGTDAGGAVTPSQLCVVGDADQSIYAFRGATIRNIEEFERDFPDAHTILLEQNYRSTQTILSAANAVISRNSGRREKRLWTESGDGAQIVGYVADTEHDEATFVAREVDALSDSGVPYRDVAVFYRTNAASRSLEEVFIRHGIGYKVVGGTRFYERREVRDIVAYLRVIANLDDSVNLRRIVNTPRRGIGDRAQATVAVHAENTGVSYFAALREAAAGNVPLLGTRGVKAIAGFVELIDGLRADHLGPLDDPDAPRDAAAAGRDVGDLVEAVLARTGYRDELATSSDPQDGTRLENVDELASVAREFALDAGGAADEGEVVGGVTDAPPPEDAATPEDAPDTFDDTSLSAFLERVSLVADADQIPDSEEGVVTLMTLHTAKGLEFPAVFVTGWEDGQFPHMRALGDPVQLAEERRLAYVGITRARERLYVSRAVTRSAWGEPVSNPESRFLSEIPAELIDWRRLEPSRAARRRYDEPRGSFGFASARGSSGNFGGGSVGGGRGDRRAPRTGPRNTNVQVQLGDIVTHEKYGVGKVVEKLGSGPTERVTFDFGSAGRVTLMPAGGWPIQKL